MASRINARTMGSGNAGIQELAAWARQLRGVAATTPDKVYDIVRDSAGNIKREWQVRMRARSHHGHIPHLPGSIGYDMRRDDDGGHAIIGPNKQTSQGPLAHLLEFGSVNNKPHLDGERALLDEGRRFYGELSKAEYGEGRSGL